MKFRYRSEDIPCTIKYIDKDKIEVNYPGMFKAVTPGQAAVFYDGDELIGGSTIDSVYMNLEKRRY